MEKKIITLVLILFASFSISSPLFAQDVYITKGSKIYHKKTCKQLKNNKTKISLSEAKKKSYKACSVCKPPVKVVAKTVNKKTTTPTKNKNTKTVSSTKNKKTSTKVVNSSTNKKNTSTANSTTGKNKLKTANKGGSKKNVGNSSKTNKQVVKSTRCTAITKAGTRCKRMTTDPSGKCYQHKK